MDLWIPFYDQISDYFSTYFWLYHPGDPDHSAYTYTKYKYTMNIFTYVYMRCYRISAR